MLRPLAATLQHLGGRDPPLAIQSQSLGGIDPNPSQTDVLIFTPTWERCAPAPGRSTCGALECWHPPTRNGRGRIWQRSAEAAEAEALEVRGCATRRARHMLDELECEGEDMRGVV